ncbi:mitogen-activated protein kinase kinase, partial [Tremellales sp. Uapishka_1]
MSSPPSLTPLAISSPSAQPKSISPTTPLSARPPSPSPSPPLGDSAEDKERSSPVDPVAPAAEPTPPPTPSAPTPQAPTTAVSNGIPPPARPTPHQTFTSPPAVPSQPRMPPSQMAGRMGPQGMQGMQGRGGMPMPLGMRGPMGMGGGGGQMQSRLPPSLQAKMDQIAASRAGAPAGPGGPLANGPNGPNPSATSMSALLHSAALQRPSTTPSIPGPASGPLGLAARRAGGAPRPNLGAMGMGVSAPGGPGARVGGLGGIGGRRGPPGGLTLSGMAGGKKEEDGNKFSDFGKIVDPSGSLKFSSKAVLHANGVDFSNGQSFKINMDEIEILDELGKGNYGTVQKVFHRPTGVTMAMKEIRLELDNSKLNAIIMELDILHRAVAPEIVEFYGAFTIESCVYYCIEFMDAGSLDALTGGGVPAKDVTEDEEGEEELRVPEPVLRRITAAIVRGLGFLKDELQIMHRDVKPTNVLINRKGEVKLCDFGVSGQLEKSLAKTNIGCQSYMAPERIKGESQNQLATYTVSSDVWSVGLSIIELAKGCYPYPPETFANVFAQLQAIVYGPAPTLPKGYSAVAQDFVAKCLIKDPNGRPTYAQLLKHPFLLADIDADVDMVGWVAQAMKRRAARGVIPLAEIEA